MKQIVVSVSLCCFFCLLGGSAQGAAESLLTGQTHRRAKTSISSSVDQALDQITETFDPAVAGSDFAIQSYDLSVLYDTSEFTLVSLSYGSYYAAGANPYVTTYDSTGIHNIESVNELLTSTPYASFFIPASANSDLFSVTFAAKPGVTGPATFEVVGTDPGNYISAVDLSQQQIGSPENIDANYPNDSTTFTDPSVAISAGDLVGAFDDFDISSDGTITETGSGSLPDPLALSDPGTPSPPSGAGSAIPLPLSAWTGLLGLALAMGVRAYVCRRASGVALQC